MHIYIYIEMNKHSKNADPTVQTGDFPYNQRNFLWIRDPWGYNLEVRTKETRSMLLCHRTCSHLTVRYSWHSSEQMLSSFPKSMIYSSIPWKKTCICIHANNAAVQAVSFLSKVLLFPLEKWSPGASKYWALKNWRNPKMENTYRQTSPQTIHKWLLWGPGKTFSTLMWLILLIGGCIS